MVPKIRENRQTGCTAESAVVNAQQKAESTFDEIKTLIFQKQADSAATFFPQKPSQRFMLKNCSKFKWSPFLVRLSELDIQYTVEKLLKSSFKCRKPYINAIFILKFMTKRVSISQISLQNFCILNTFQLFCPFSL